jgi:hypothetical protein
MMDGLAFLPVLDLTNGIRRMCMSYQVEEIVVPALAHVVGSGITVDCGIMYVPNDWWRQVGYVLRPDGLLDFALDYAV